LKGNKKRRYKKYQGMEERREGGMEGGREGGREGRSRE